MQVHQEESAIEKAVAEWDWTRNMLVAGLYTAPPTYDPFLLASLFDTNGYHSNAIYWKQAATVGQGYTCSDQLAAIIKHPNVDDSFQDLLDKTQLDLETYGNFYVEVATDDFKNWALYHSPALVTRVRPPIPGDVCQDESYLQFVYGYLNGWHNLQAKPFEKYKYGMRSGIRMMKLPSHTGDRWYGKPDYIACVDLLKLNFSITSLARTWFQNAMVLDKLFTMEGTKLTPEQKNDLSTFMRRSLKGLDNANKSLLLELQRGSKLTVQDMQAQIKEASFTGLRRDNILEIAAAHRVPLALLGDTPTQSLGATGLIDGMLRVLKISVADARQRKVEAFWQRLFLDMNLPGWDSFKLTAIDPTGGTITGKDLNQLVGAGAISPQEAQNEWLEQSGAFTPEGANQFIKMLSVVEKGVSKL